MSSGGDQGGPKNSGIKSDEKQGKKDTGEKSDFLRKFRNSKNKSKTIQETPKEQPPSESLKFELDSALLKWIKDENGDMDLKVDPYPVSSPIKARVLILNIQKYLKKDHQWDDRKGSGQDVKNLCLAFYKLGIKPADISIRGPVIYKDQLTTTVRDFAGDKSNQDLDVFITVIMAHGNRIIGGEEFIYMSDWDQVELKKDIVSKFNGENAASLLDKPKLFFIQACRGGEEDRGKRTPMKIKEMCSSPLPPPFIPVETDIFIAQPSAPDHKSYRSGLGGGSFFIQFLANRLYHDAVGKNLELQQIMTGVAHDVAKVELDPENPSGSKSEDKSFKQAVWCTNSLRRPFHFKQLQK